MLAGGASNLAATSLVLLKQVKERMAQVGEFNGVRESEVPADAVTARASGLAPHISPDYAKIQVDRVAAHRGLDPVAVEKLVERHTRDRLAGFLTDWPGVLELLGAHGPADIIRRVRQAEARTSGGPDARVPDDAIVAHCTHLRGERGFPGIRQE